MVSLPRNHLYRTAIHSRNSRSFGAGRFALGAEIDHGGDLADECEIAPNIVPTAIFGSALIALPKIGICWGHVWMQSFRTHKKVFIHRSSGVGPRSRGVNVGRDLTRRGAVQCCIKDWRCTTVRWDPNAQLVVTWLTRTQELGPHDRQAGDFCHVSPVSATVNIIRAIINAAQGPTVFVSAAPSVAPDMNIPIEPRRRCHRSL